MRGHRIIYSAAEMAWLAANRTLPLSDYHAGFRAAFARPDVTAANLHALRKRRGWRTGRTGRFEKGAVPANKGKPMPFHPNSAATRFRPGNRSGTALAIYKPIGTERLSKEGYLERKINDDMPLRRRWRAVHLINWEAVNGPLPRGMALKCLDTNRANLDPANWSAIPRALLPRLNGGRQKTRLAYNDASPELRPIILTVARLDHQARTARAGKGDQP